MVCFSSPKIQQQVQRSVKLTSQLNKFSHLADNNMAEVEINDLRVVLKSISY